MEGKRFPLIFLTRGFKGNKQKISRWLMEWPRKYGRFKGSFFPNLVFLIYNNKDSRRSHERRLEAICLQPILMRRRSRIKNLIVIVRRESWWCCSICQHLVRRGPIIKPVVLSHRKQWESASATNVAAARKLIYNK